MNSKEDKMKERLKQIMFEKRGITVVVNGKVNHPKNPKEFRDLIKKSKTAGDGRMRSSCQRCMSGSGDLLMTEYDVPVWLNGSVSEVKRLSCMMCPKCRAEVSKDCYGQHDDCSVCWLIRSRDDEVSEK